MKRKALALLLVCTLSFFAHSTFTHAEEAADGPNIVFILVDDMGWKDLGCYGSTFYETPHIDKLAESGVRFTNAYAAAPLCSATRAAALTGWSPARQHLIGVTPHSREKYLGFKDYTSWEDEADYRFSRMPLLLSKQLGQLHPDHSTTIAERLKEKGYATAFIGKWHLGPDADKYPEKHGFDVNIAGSHYGWPDSYFSPYKIPNLTDGKPGEHLTDRLTDESLKWMENQHKQKKPFFLYLSHFAVHGPWQSKDEYTEHFEGKVDPNDQHRNADYAGMIKSLDDSIGRLMDRIQQLGIEKNTLVIFASDNGGIAMEKKCRKTGKVAPITSMHPLRGEKALLYEGGVRVPCIVSMPGTVMAGETSKEPVNSVDFYPTLLEAVGLQKKDDNPLDGKSLLAHVRSGAPLKRDYLTWFMPANIKAGEGMDPCASIRQGDYKYLTFFDGRKELYDLSDDIGEKKNLADANPELCKQLDALLMADLKRKNAHIPIKNPNYKGPADGGQAGPGEKPAAGNPTAATRESLDGFQTVDGKLTQERGLGYVLTAEAGKIAWALKPLGSEADVVQVRSSIRIRANAKTANAFLAIGEGTDPKKVLKIGVYYGRKTISIQPVSMPRAAVGTYAEANLKKGELLSFDLTIDQVNRTIAVDIDGNALKASFPKQIKRITHAGYASIRSSQECSPLAITPAGAAPAPQEAAIPQEAPQVETAPEKAPALKETPGDSYVQVCPRMFACDQTQRPWVFTPINDYLPTITNTDNWKSVLDRTNTLKLYINPLTNDKLHEDGDAYRKQIAGLVSKTGLAVCVEVGGSRDGGGTPKRGDQAGEFSARKDQMRLQKWLDVPGARLDAIVTDHSTMWYIREQTEKDIPLLVQEYVDYVVAMKKWRPGLKVGMIESLGYFKIVRDDKVYPQTDKRLPPLEFKSFLSQVLAEAKKKQVTIDFFDVDFGFLGVNFDSRRGKPNWDYRTDPADYGRILGAEEICRELGVDVGVIFNDRMGTDAFKELGFETLEAADTECGRRNVQFIKDYLAGGGAPDRIIFQSWMTHPTTTGPETAPHSFLGITKRQMDAMAQVKEATRKP